MSEIFLLPGKLAITSSPGVIRTVLGSCIAVVLYDTAAGLGGVNHYLLPSARNAQDSNSLKYGSYAIPALIYEMLELGASHENLRAEIYGGGAVVSILSDDFAIGADNISVARSELKKWRISIIASDVGGNRGRKIEFSMPKFKTDVKYIATQSHNP